LNRRTWCWRLRESFRVLYCEDRSDEGWRMNNMYQEDPIMFDQGPSVISLQPSTEW